MPFGVVLKQHLFEWVTQDFFQKIPLKDLDTLKNYLESLELCYQNFANLQIEFSRNSDRDTINQNESLNPTEQINKRFKEEDIKPFLVTCQDRIQSLFKSQSFIAEKYKSFFEYCQEPSLLGIIEADFKDFFDILSHAFLDEINRLKKEGLKKFAEENFDPDDIKKIFDELNSFMQKEDKLKIVKLELLNFLEKKDDPLKKITQILVYNIQEAIEYIPVTIPKRRGFVDILIAKEAKITLLNTLASEIHGIVEKKQKISELLLNNSLHYAIQNISRNWLTSKSFEMAKQPKKMYSIYPDPWFAILRASLKDDEPLQETRFDVLLETINQDLNEDESSNLLDLLGVTVVQQEVLKKNISLLELLRLDFFTLQDLRQILVERDEDPNFIAGVIKSLLFKDFKGFVKCLFLFGPNVNYRKSQHDPTCLHVACSLPKQEDIVEILLSAGANVNLVDPFGITAIHCLFKAVEYRPEGESFRIAKLLSKHGADLNRKNPAGDTPLQIALILLSTNPSEAIKNTYIAIAKLFIESGADLHVKNLNDKTAIDLAKSLGEKSILESIEVVLKKQEEEKMKEEARRKEQEKKIEEEKKCKEEKKGKEDKKREEDKILLPSFNAHLKRKREDENGKDEKKETSETDMVNDEEEEKETEDKKAKRQKKE